MLFSTLSFSLSPSVALEPVCESLGGSKGFEDERANEDLGVAFLGLGVSQTDVEPDSISLKPRNRRVWEEVAWRLAKGILDTVFVSG